MEEVLLVLVTENCRDSVTNYIYYLSNESEGVGDALLDMDK